MSYKKTEQLPKLGFIYDSMKVSRHSFLTSDSMFPKFACLFVCFFFKKNSFREMGQTTLYNVTRCEAVRQSQRTPVVQCEVTGVVDHKKKDMRFRVDQYVDRVDIDRRGLIFVGESGDDESALVFADESGEEILVPKTLIGDLWVYLKENDKILHSTFENKDVGVVLPSRAEATIQETEASSKKSSQVSPTHKEALLTNGRRVKVPPHCNNGDKIIVRLPDEEFSSKA